MDELNTDYINDELVKRLIAATTVVMDDEFERRYRPTIPAPLPSP